MGLASHICRAKRRSGDRRYSDFCRIDSADVWANRDLFYFDERGNPTLIAGVPPDYFSPTGQRWGNPLYRWDVMAAAKLQLVGRAHQGRAQAL